MEKNLPPYPPKTVTKLRYPPYPSIDMEPSQASKKQASSPFLSRRRVFLDHNFSLPVVWVVTLIVRNLAARKDQLMCAYFSGSKNIYTSGGIYMDSSASHHGVRA